MKIKPLHKDFKAPVYSSLGAAAFDIRAVENFNIHNGLPVTINLGFAAEIPNGYAGFIIPRSGLGTKYGMRLLNSTGLIDSDYRGEWMATLTADADLSFKKGDRILQCAIVPINQVDFEIVKELSNTERGNGGFGSTGND